MADELNDVKPTEASSASPTPAEGVTAGAPPVQTAAKPEVNGLDKVIQDAFDKASSQDVKAEEKVQETKAPEEKQEEPETRVEEGKEQEAEKGPIPYERFAEVNQAKVQYEQQLAEYKPLVDAHQSVIQHCQTNNISPDEFADWMDIAALVKTDPIEAMKRLQPQLERLQAFTGDKLPPEYQKAVNDGEITLEYAKRLVKAESQSKFGEQRQQMTLKQFEEQQQQRYVQELTSSLSNWVTSKKGSDPDFVPKSKEIDADGKFEFFLHKFAVDSKNSKVKGPHELIALAEKTLSLINSNPRFKTKVNGTPPVVRSSNSSSRISTPPKTVEEAISLRAKEHGIEWSPSSRR